MEQMILSLAIALMTGLMMSRAAKLVKLPAVTAYLITGLILGPYVIGHLGIPGVGYASMEYLQSLKTISQVALGFIA